MDTVPGFEAATGIKVVYDTFDSNETLETRLLAGKTGYAGRRFVPEVALKADNDPSPAPFGALAPNAAQAAIIALVQRTGLKRGAFRPMLSRLLNLHVSATQDLLRQLLDCLQNAGCYSPGPCDNGTNMPACQMCFMQQVNNGQCQPQMMACQNDM